jgi:hypothetical protein
MNDRFADLPRDVIDALDTERGRPGMAPSARARARMRLQASLLSGTSAHDSDHVNHDAAPGRRLWTRLRHLNPAATAAVGFIVGVGAGLALHARMDAARSVAPVTTVVARPSTSAAPIASAAPTALPPAMPSPSASSEARTADSATPRTPSASTLVAERALLDVAHSALAGGNASGALAALTQHARRFPNGVYREEREAITVQCLRALGRTDEAARRAAAFRARYPRSLFLSTVGRESETDSSAQAPR